MKPTIQGHPHLRAPSVERGKPAVHITLCSECGSMKSVLFLGKAGDRWICAKCRNEGGDKPASVKLYG